MRGYEDTETEAERKRRVATEYIIWHEKEYGFPPSYRSIGKALGGVSTSTVYRVVAQLEERGRVERNPISGAVRAVNNGNPDFCRHDWRTKSSGRVLKLVCIACQHRTEVEYDPDPKRPSTWLRYAGEVT